MNARVKEGMRTVRFTLLLTLVSITSVSALQLATAERVNRNAALFLQRAVLEASGAPPAEGALAVAEWYRRAVEEEPAGSPSRFRVRDPATGRLLAHVYLRQGRGLWGTITAVIGMDAERRAFKELRVLDQNETPGLGARIVEPWFVRQIENKSGPFTLKPEGTRSAAPTEIDGLTGATITSVAVRDMLNAVLREAGQEKKEGSP